MVWVVNEVIECFSSVVLLFSVTCIKTVLGRNKGANLESGLQCIDRYLS